MAAQTHCLTLDEAVMNGDHDFGKQCLPKRLFIRADAQFGQSRRYGGLIRRFAVERRQRGEFPAHFRGIT